MNFPHLHGDLLDQDAFPQPQKGFFADLDVGVGAVGLHDEFHRLPAATRLKILADWHAGIETERKRAVAHLFREVTHSMGTLAAPDKIAHFRSVCRDLGIACPPDIALLIQQFCD